MKFLKVKFHHWTGIRLGLGLDDLELDFTKSNNRICLVLGTNGSGKTTILEGLTLFTDIYSAQRDSNDFIDTDENGNKDGYRHIYFESNGDVYLSKVEWINDKTRCYLTKVDKNNWDTDIEDLNPSGNVRSYEEQLELRFGLTKEYNKLLFLGPGLSDIITMTPSERKNNISKFTPNIDKYLELHKLTGKYYSKLKSDLNVVTSEIKRLGEDRDKVESFRDASKVKYNSSLEKLNQFKNVESNVLKTISYLSVNGVSIKDIYEKKVFDLNQLISQLNEKNIIFKNYCAKYGLSTGLSQNKYDELVLSTRDELTGLKFQESNFQNRNKELLDSKQNLLTTLESRKSMYNQYVKDNNPEKFLNEQRALNAELLEIQETLEKVYSDHPILSNKQNVLFNKDDATKYLIFVDQLMTKIDSLETIYEEYGIFSKYVSNELSTVSSESHRNELLQENELLGKKIDSLRTSIAGYESAKNISDMLNQIPKDCKNQNCPFIEKTKMFTSVSENKDNLISELQRLQNQFDENSREISRFDLCEEKAISFAKDIQSLMGFINSYSELIAKFPDREIVTNPRSIIKNMVFLLPNARTYSEYSFIIERYNEILNRLVEIKDTIEQTADYQKNLKIQETEIENLEKTAQNLSNELQQLYNENQNINLSVTKCQTKLSEVSIISDTRKFIVSALKTYDTKRKEIKKLRKHYIASRYFSDKLSELRTKMQFISEDVSQYERELATAEYNLRRYDEFVIQRDNLSKEYELLDVLRKCWSPTTGIPLIFIQDFMNTLLKDANNYLKQIWENEDFLISGFDIDEKNFFILVDRGDEFVKKDASQCSGAERAMLCTVLSLALLKQLPDTESIYNIPKFDEIDGTLDYDKKRIFLGILTDLLDDIKAEQAFVISHSDTFQSDVDVILLNGSEQYESRLLNGNYNVIYRY